MAATLLRPGDVVGGFEVEDLIGIGGMATVYRARQVSLGRPVALKVLSRQFTGDETFRERFRREGMHAASLEHPNIVPVYDSGEQDGLLYLAMRYVEGQSLAELLSGQGVSADRAIEIMQPIASALDCAHAAGLIHRDIKPQNILITNQGHPYLADFGVAKDANAPGLTATGGFVGSVNYASPEQIKGLTLTPASDIYALTAVLYHCLSGDVPYPGESEAGVMHSHLNEPPPTLPALEGADSEFHTVFARGMAKDPGARYGHAGDLINAAAVCVSRMPSERRKSIPAFPKKDRGKQAEDSAPRSKDGEGAVASAASANVFGSMTAVDQRREPAPPEEPPEPPRKRRMPKPKAPTVPRPKLPSASGIAKRVPRPKLPSASGIAKRVPRPKLPQGADAARRRRVAAIAGGCGLVALVIALVALGGGGGGSSEETVRKGTVSLSYSQPWRAAGGGANSYGLKMKEPIALGDGDSTLLAGMLANGAPVPGGLPPALAAQLAGTPARKSTHLGSAPAVLYTSTARRGGTDVAAYIVPTDEGDIAVLCTGAAGTACAGTAATLRVSGPDPVAAGADPALASKLDSTLTPVSKARKRTSSLTVSQPAPRAKSARGIAAADTSAAKGLGDAQPEPRDRAAVAALAAALRREATALDRTAVAAKARRYAKYDQATKSVHSAGRSLALAAATLRRMGFTHVPRLRPLDIPALQRPKPEPEFTESSEPSTSIESAPPVTSTPAPEPAPAPAPSGGSGNPIISAPK